MENRFEELEFCTICPRECGVNRNAGQKGYCGRSDKYEIASICRHMGEEPAISGKYGICNVFFSGCNLRCLYCQNHQISRKNSISSILTLEEAVSRIKHFLDCGIESLGFVSPSHFTPHVKEIIQQLRKDGYSPITIYNSNCFDNVDAIKSLEGLIDVYLPDLKYINAITSLQWSDAYRYPEISAAAVREMYHQKGSTLVINDNNYAVTGLIVRHLVLPGRAAESVKMLEWIAEYLSTSLHISLMSQYYPTSEVNHHPELSRTLAEKEYSMVVKAMEDLGFYKGWIQDFKSAATYRPDFRKSDPFDEEV